MDFEKIDNLMMGFLFFDSPGEMDFCLTGFTREGDNTFP